MRSRMTSHTKQDINWKNPSVNKNEEQKTAVVDILNCASYPAPYVLFGPPGTGKTTTVVEAIAQIVKHKPQAHILIAIGNNATCDDITLRLIKFVSRNKILRLYSPAYEKKPDKIDERLVDISNFRDRESHECETANCFECNEASNVSMEEFYTTNVIVSTVINCGKFIRDGFKSDHFDYIFIDEAACQCEQQTLVPITGLGTTHNGKINAQIVLAGDHKQLGMIVKNRKAKEMDMEMSMMERMMLTKENYKQLDPPKQTKNKKKMKNQNTKFVTQLIQNYRSHPAIIEFSNNRFYDGRLQYCCAREIRDFAVGWGVLTNVDFPVLFHSVDGKCVEKNLSWENELEAEVVEEYVKVLIKDGINGKKVKQEDIGVITPYRSQRLLLREKLSRRYQNLDIGTVDSFQGKEKKIIILNTVRSRSKYIGFLTSEKRLNVALTRAQSLNIIIGNHQTLNKSPLWADFIAYCVNNGALENDH